MAQDSANDDNDENPKIQVDEIEEDEGIDDDDDEEKALVENETEQNIDDTLSNTLDTTTNTNTTENTTTTIVNDSDPGSERWKDERWHQENDNTSKRSSNTSIISGTGSGTKVQIVCQDEIIVEINGLHESNSDIEMDTNNDSLQDDEDDESANSEQKLLKTTNNNEFVAVKIHPEVKNMQNGVGVNGFDELCLKINQMGW